MPRPAFAAAVVAIGVAVRLVGFYGGADAVLSQRVELVTPVTSPDRALEGVFLEDLGMSPYAGSSVHIPPLVLLLLRPLLAAPRAAVAAAYVALDLAAAVLSAALALAFDRYQRRRAESVPAVIKVSSTSCSTAELALLLFFLNPLTVLSCLARSTLGLSTVAILFAIWQALRGNPVLAHLGVALAAYQTVYPVMLVLPVAFLLRDHPTRPVSYLRSVLSFTVSAAGLLYLSRLLVGSWDFVEHVYGFALTAPDLTPNIGLFWYFFTEMFEHFHAFFVFVFQYHAFIYAIPLSIRLRDHPMMLALLLLIIVSVFKSYPSAGDIGVYLPFLAVQRDYLVYMRYSLFLSVVFLASAIGGPLVYNLWIYEGTTNANFFYSATLLYSLVQVWLMIDSLHSFVKVEQELSDKKKR